jgi:hypothetical protein
MLDFVSCDLLIVLNRRELDRRSDEELFSTPDTSPAHENLSCDLQSLPADQENIFVGVHRDSAAADATGTAAPTR